MNVRQRITWYSQFYPRPRSRARDNRPDSIPEYPESVLWFLVEGDSSCHSLPNRPSSRLRSASRRRKCLCKSCETLFAIATDCPSAASVVTIDSRTIGGQKEQISHSKWEFRLRNLICKRRSRIERGQMLPTGLSKVHAFRSFSSNYKNERSNFAKRIKSRAMSTSKQQHGQQNETG